jgi:hypothetical protein
MEIVYRLIRRVPAGVEFIGGAALLAAFWFLKQPLFFAVFLLWFAFDAGSRGLRLRMWGMLAAAAIVLIYATMKFPVPPDFHPSIPA